MHPVADWSALPLGLVSKPYLARMIGVPMHTVASAMKSRGILSALTLFAAHHCGEAAFAFGPWVESWGRDRVLAWLDAHDTEGARILRDGIGATEADVRAAVQERRNQRMRTWLAGQTKEDRAAVNARVSQRKAAKRPPSSRRVRMARQEADLRTMPVGLLPVLTVAKVARCSIKAIERHMAEHKIEPYSTQKNSGFPNFAGAWKKLVDSWGADRARAWVTAHLPQYLAKFDSRDSTGLLPPQYEEALRNAPLGCVPDGVISVAYGVPIHRVSEIRSKRGIVRLHGGTDGAFPHRLGSFDTLIARLGYDRARLWLAGYAPQYVEHFDADTNHKAAIMALAPAPSPKSATGAVSKRGAAARPGIDRAVTVAIAKRAERDGLARDAADRRRPPAPEMGPVKTAARVETIEEWLARGGRVTRLVGAGSPRVGQVVDVCEFGGGGCMSAVTLHHGNCLDVLAQYPADHFDICVTDLPYAEETHRGARTLTGNTDRKRGGAGSKGTKLVDFPSITFAECRSILSAAGRVTRRWVISTLDYRHCAKLEEDPPDGLEFVRFGVWAKPNPAPQITGDRPGQGFEAVAILHRPGKKRWNGGGLPALWTTQLTQARDSYPTQKPIALVRSFVAQFSDGGSVLDCCMGSGTTGVVCVERGLQFVGIDLRAEAVERARVRIDATSRQPDMFTAPKAVSQDLFGGTP